ncbi:hypothetical protein GGF37_007091, partial [Kickxella alabastrina]
MAALGVAPTALAVRHALLPPARSQPRYTRAWSLPLAVARDLWDAVAASRRAVWMQQREPGAQPVVVNDIAAQLIRVAAVARNVAFGEDVLAALRREAAHFGADALARLPPDLQCAPNVRVYTAVVTLYANDADLRGIARTWADMLHAGVAPNLFTYTSLVVGLHKVALRKRWRAAQEAAERSDASDADQPRADQPATTTQDDMIAHIEDWLFSDRAPPDAALPELFLSDVAPDVDLPLSTLLLRYHALRI